MQEDKPVQLSAVEASIQKTQRRKKSPKGSGPEHYQMHRHHEVLLVGTSVGLPTKAVRQLQLTGARQADCLSLIISVLADTCRATTWPGYESRFFF